MKYHLLVVAALVLAGTALYFWLLRKSESVECFSVPASDKMFVSVASFRDIDCACTINQLFEKAERPDDLVIGICQQNSTHSPEEDCISRIKQERRGQCRVLTVNFSEASGPTTARAKIATALYQNEALFVQIDSHMKPAQGWDALIRKDIGTAQRMASSNKVVVSTYPLAHEQSDKKGVPRLIEATWNSSVYGDGLITQKALIKDPPPKGTLYRQPFVAAGFMATTREVMIAVPFDPQGYPGLFNGEELLMAARYYTHGIPVFSPSTNAFTHKYTRKGEKKVWDDRETAGRFKADQRASQSFVKGLLGLRGGLVPDGYAYGLGSAKSIGSFWTFAGLG